MPPSLITVMSLEVKVALQKSRMDYIKKILDEIPQLTENPRYVSTTLNLTTCPVYLWTDSNVALTWILSHPSRWKDFVRNRVSLIQELLPQAKWMFISGKENPADCASRGLTAQQLSKHDLWWQESSWRIKTSDLWSHPSPPINLNVDLEERPGLSLAVWRGLFPELKLGPIRPHTTAKWSELIYPGRQPSLRQSKLFNFPRS